MKKIFMLVALLIFAVAPTAIHAFDDEGHEYAPIEEKAINYKDWTYQSLSDDKPVNLRTLASNKQTRLLVVVYFAPWCHNWQLEAPVVKRLYEKYKGQGLDVVGVSEYGSRDEVRNYFGPSGPPFTIVSESEKREDRDKTSHYGYRQATGDARRWGSPYNVFLEPSKLNAKGDVLTEKAWVVNGELVEADAEKFIRAHLGLDANASLVPCQN